MTNMKRHFYSDIIRLDLIIEELGTLDLTRAQRAELVVLVESSVHNIILDTVLSELSEKEKKVFLSHVAHGSHDHIWKLLDKRAGDIEHKISRAVHELKKELFADICEAKKLKKHL